MSSDDLLINVLLSSRPPLNNRCQRAQTAASKQPENDKSREMTSRMQSVPEQEARSSLPHIPAEITAAEDDDNRYYKLFCVVLVVEVFGCLQIRFRESTGRD